MLSQREALTRPDSHMPASPRLTALIPLAMLAAALVAGVVLGAGVGSPRFASSTLVAVIAVATWAVCFWNPTAAVVIALGLGVTAGFSRRFIEYFVGDGPLLPYLTIIPSSAVLLVWIRVMASPQRANLRKLPKFFLAFVAVVAIATVNPLGAGPVNNILTGSLALGALCGFALCYWGVVNSGPLIMSVVVLGLITALYMINQTIQGLTPWDQQWVDTDGYAALYIGPDEVRPLGLASSSSESTALVGTAALAAVMLVLTRRRMWWLLVPAVIDGYAVLNSGTRTYFILMLLGLSIAISIKRKHPWRVFLASAVICVPLVVILSSAAVGTAEDGSGRILTTLSGNEDSENSTIPIHADIAFGALKQGALSGIGTGIGRIGILAAPGAGGSETDLSNYALVGGIPGIAVCIWIWVFFVRRLGPALRGGGAGAISGVCLIATFSQWFNPSYYGVMIIVWSSAGIFAGAREVSRA